MKIPKLLIIGFLLFAMHTAAHDNDKKDQKQETPKAEVFKSSQTVIVQMTSIKKNTACFVRCIKPLLILRVSTNTDGHACSR